MKAVEAVAAVATANELSSGFLPPYGQICRQHLARTNDSLTPTAPEKEPATRCVPTRDLHSCTQVAQVSPAAHSAWVRPAQQRGLVAGARGARSSANPARRDGDNSRASLTHRPLQNGWSLRFTRQRICRLHSARRGDTLLHIQYLIRSYFYRASNLQNRT
jgi:hypothetical protein